MAVGDEQCGRISAEISNRIRYHHEPQRTIDVALSRRKQGFESPWARRPLPRFYHKTRAPSLTLTTTLRPQAKDRKALSSIARILSTAAPRTGLRRGVAAFPFETCSDSYVYHRRRQCCGGVDQREKIRAERFEIPSGGNGACDYCRARGNFLFPLRERPGNKETRGWPTASKRPGKVACGPRLRPMPGSESRERVCQRQIYLPSFKPSVSAKPLARERDS
jgi:hypothetical protein